MGTSPKILAAFRTGKRENPIPDRDESKPRKPFESNAEL